MAIEDISLADPRALEQSMAAMQAVHFLGIPEGDLALGQAAIYLAVAPKSDAAYRAMSALKDDVQNSMAEPVPLHLRNAPTAAMKQWGYGAGYQHAHQFEDAIPGMECLPPSLAGKQYYLPTDRGLEKRIGERLEEIRKIREATKGEILEWPLKHPTKCAAWNRGTSFEGHYGYALSRLGVSRPSQRKWPLVSAYPDYLRSFRVDTTVWWRRRRSAFCGFSSARRHHFLTSAPFPMTTSEWLASCSTTAPQPGSSTSRGRLT